MAPKAKICMLGLVLLALTFESGSAKIIGPRKANLQQEEEFIYGYFPDNFLWGLATASYQIEGAWDEGIKGENIWDTFSHRADSPIFDGSTGDVACDSYHKYKEDVQLLKNMGADYYRFSLSWSRLLPDGSINTINQEGIDYYNNVINELIANDIIPMVTLYHWDLPETLQQLGGWPSEEVIPYYSNYSRFAFEQFGDRVKHWITFNEPAVFCGLGYGDGVHAPGLREPGVLTYKCAHTVLKSHALAYRIYDNDFRPTQNGVIGITLNTDWSEPASDSPEDIEAAERSIQFYHGWFGSPVYFGKYPDVMRQYVDEKSRQEGLSESRLPEFTEEWRILLKGSSDFLGLNHYTSSMIRATTGPDWGGDSNTTGYKDSSWEESIGSSWLYVVPWGFRSLLTWLDKTYDHPIIYVTENGYSDVEANGINDDRRVNYYNMYINNMLQAILLDGVNVASYTAWSLMDNFEWARGYSERFGVHFVDFNSPDRTRTQKESAKFLTQLFADNGFPEPK